MARQNITDWLDVNVLQNPLAMIVIFILCLCLWKYIISDLSKPRSSRLGRYKDKK